MQLEITIDNLKADYEDLSDTLSCCLIDESEDVVWMKLRLCLIIFKLCILKVEERSGGSDTDSEIMRLRERKEELERARRTEAARARRAQREILNEVRLERSEGSLLG